ncbi:AraC family transcriptional regulator [Pelagibius sp.]|uniref:AraC family transcriptional regulator n=1 Tax=Pelagibius sp. TaxID=1931238 RepID=UPI003BB16204
MASCEDRLVSAVNPVGKAIWFIETRFADAVSLDDIAGNVGISRYQMSRAFSLATGWSLVRYLRGRRLTEAARSLAGGAPDILAVALNAGYGSHEAFTRAFRDLFGLTPEQVRARGDLDALALVEPLKMDENFVDGLEPTRFEDSKALLVAGLGARYDWESSKAIPAQWQRFVPYYDNLAGQVGQMTYGVCCNSDGAGSFDYICGVEVTDFSQLPEEFSRVRIPAQRYAVFTHHDHISTIRRTVNTIWNKWLSESGHEVADSPDFERYDERFDPQTGNGAVEIWIPIKA